MLYRGRAPLRRRAKQGAGAVLSGAARSTTRTPPLRSSSCRRTRADRGGGRRGGRRYQRGHIPATCSSRDGESPCFQTAPPCHHHRDGGHVQGILPASSNWSGKTGAATRRSHPTVVLGERYRRRVRRRGRLRARPRPVGVLLAHPLARCSALLRRACAAEERLLANRMGRHPARLPRASVRLRRGRRMDSWCSAAGCLTSYAPGVSRCRWLRRAATGEVGGPSGAGDAGVCSSGGGG